MYTRAEFSEMKYDVFADWTTPIWKQYEALKSRAALSEIPRGVFMDDEQITEADVDRLVRYTILFCSRHNNPLARERDIAVRREAIWSLLHISKKDKLRNYVEYWHKWVTMVMVSFMRLENDREYTTWLAAMVEYYQYIEYQMTNHLDASDPDKAMSLKQRLSGMLPTLAKNLKEMEEKLFPDTVVRDAVTEMENLLLESKIGFAELIAEQYPRQHAGDPSTFV